MKKLILILSASLIPVSSMAAFGSYGDFGIEAGIRQQSGTSASTGTTTTSQNGFQVGVAGHIPFSGPLGARVGFMYTQRPLIVSLDATKDEAKTTMNYLDLPVGLSYKFADYGSVFGGISLGINLDSACSGSGLYSSCKVTDVKSPITPLLIGASFMFMPQFGATVFFESLSGEVAKDLKDYKAVGVNLRFTFD